MFAKTAVSLLAAAEAENNLPLGICAALASGRAPSRAPYLATIEDGRAVAVAIMTPPRKLVLSAAPSEALEAVCADLVDGGIAVPGVSGPAPVAEAFAALWRRRTGNDMRRERAQRIYQLMSVLPPRPATWTGPTPNGVRVTLVYTPPAVRGHGYASSCVAALSALLLASGRKYCFLFTDLANPTSNSIYTKIGYRPVCDVDEYRFGPREATG